MFRLAQNGLTWAPEKVFVAQQKIQSAQSAFDRAEDIIYKEQNSISKMQLRGWKKLKGELIIYAE